MRLAGGLPRPRVWIIDDTAPNAFATGRDPEHASVAVTTGLLQKLDREELQGVIGHEMSHIGNLDIRFTLLVGVLVGAIALLADWFLRFTYWGGGRRSSSDSDRGGGGAMALIFVLALVLALVAPLIGRLVQAAVSRSRESLADATAVELTRNPVGLARALRKISDDPEVLEVANRATQHLYIVNPIKIVRGAGEVAVGHPSADRRADPRPRGDRRADGNDPLAQWTSSPRRTCRPAGCATYVTDTWHADFVVAHGRADPPGRRCLGSSRLMETGSRATLRFGSIETAVSWSRSPSDLASAGIGSLLLERVVAAAREAGCSRLWLTTTNDNVDALRFYQRRGFALSALRTGVVVEARRTVKPDLPATGAYGIPMRDELDLELPWRPEGCDRQAPIGILATARLRSASRGSSVGRAPP